MKTALNVTFLCIMCFVAAAARAEDMTDDQARLQGVWLLSGGEIEGQPLKEILQARGIRDLKVTFSGDVMTMTGSGAPDRTYRYALTPTGTPKVMTVSTTETHGKAPQESVLHGIYEINGEQLKLCLPKDPSVQRPERFDAPSGSRLSVLVLVRQMDGDKPRAESGQ